MNSSGNYQAIAHVYDLLNAEIDYRAWADFFEECFRRYLPARPELVLDLACGTGRMTLELASRGYDMIGIDGSAEMLSEAYAQNNGRFPILFLQQDMRAFELYGTVGATTCCLDSVNYLLTERDLASCFACVRNYLDPGGLFLFDMNTPYRFREVYGQNAYILEDERIIDGTAFPIYCGWQNHYDEQTGICDFDLSLFEELPNESYRRSDEHQQEKCYALADVRRVLEETGFECLGVWRDTSFSPLTKNAERWYFCARAKKPSAAD